MCSTTFGFSGEDSVCRLELVHYTNKLYGDVPGQRSSGHACLQARIFLSIPKEVTDLFFFRVTQKREYTGDVMWMCPVYLRQAFIFLILRSKHIETVVIVLV